MIKDAKTISHIKHLAKKAGIANYGLAWTCWEGTLERFYELAISEHQKPRAAGDEDMAVYRAIANNYTPTPPSVPEGWELVPTELGTELYDACERACRKGYGWDGLDELMARIDDAYALTTLAAAPKPEDAA